MRRSTIRLKAGNCSTYSVCLPSGGVSEPVAVLGCAGVALVAICICRTPGVTPVVGGWVLVIIDVVTVVAVVVIGDVALGGCNADDAVVDCSLWSCWWSGEDRLVSGVGGSSEGAVNTSQKSISSVSADVPRPPKTAARPPGLTSPSPPSELIPPTSISSRSSSSSFSSVRISPPTWWGSWPGECGGWGERPKGWPCKPRVLCKAPGEAPTCRVAKRGSLVTRRLWSRFVSSCAFVCLIRRRHLSNHSLEKRV